MSNLRHIASLLLVSAMLTACGSGGGGSSASAQPDQIVTTPGVNDPSSNPDVDSPSGSRATLSWSAPTVREDGSAFAENEIAGYEVYHIEDANGEMDIIEVGANSTEYSISLAAGSHELGVAVVDINGVKSQMSELQTVEIN